MRRLILMTLASCVIVVFGILEIAHFSELVERFVPDRMVSMVDEKKALFVICAAALVMIFVWAEYFWEKHKQSTHKKIPAENPQPIPPPTKVVPVQSLGPDKDDPRIVIEFLDERKDQLYKKTALMLTNAGGSEALDVQIESIQLRGQKVSFPRISGAMLAGKTERFDPKTEGKWGPFNTALFVKVLLEEWETYRDAKMTALSFPVRVSYTNFAKTTSFETNCELHFYPYREIRNNRSPNPQPIIEFMNYEFSARSLKM